MASASEVPGKYDVVINGQGYVFLDSLMPNLPFRSSRAIYGQTQPFVERQNVSNSYGDNAQDFFFNVRQRDWSSGEQQKYFRVGNDGRYWMGQSVDVSIPGQVRLAQSVSSLTFAAAVKAGSREGQSYRIVAASSTNLYRVVEDGTISDLGAHGLGAAPSQFGICTDGLKNYLTTTSAGTVGVRKWDGSAFSTFSASGADAIEFLNNTLYGLRKSAGGGDLVRWDTSGTLTSLFSWKGGDGSATGGTICRLVPFGGKLLILWSFGQEAAELWIYDGVAPVRLEVFPENFTASDIEVLYGIAYIGGAFIKPKDVSNVYARPAVLFFDGSQIGKIWEANDFNTTANSQATYLLSGPNMALGIKDGKLIYTDETTGNLMVYNPVLGSVSTIGSYTPNTGDSVRMVSTGQIQVMTRDLTTGYFLSSNSYPSSGYIISSLFDFDSSLAKQFRGIKVEFDAASDGNGGSVDIAYQIDGLSGSWTTLQTGAVSGTEYTLSNVSGHSIAVKITLNKGTSTSGPVLKSLGVRGAPVLPHYPRCRYVLDCTGTVDQPRRLRDGSPHPLTGYEQVQNLVTALNATSPISITDKVMGTFTGFIDVNDPDGFDVFEMHPTPSDVKHPGSFVVRLTVRGV